MTAENKKCGKLWKPRIVPCEGFTQITPAKCSNENCLSGGVHPI